MTLRDWLDVGLELFMGCVDELVKLKYIIILSIFKSIFGRFDEPWSESLDDSGSTLDDPNNIDK